MLTKSTVVDPPSITNINAATVSFITASSLRDTFLSVQTIV